MTNILVVYTSTLGNTHKMAEAIADGARSVAATSVILREATAATKEEVRACDALLLGTPIRHRSADARVKQFIENTIEVLWLTDELVGKVGGVFSVGVATAMREQASKLRNWDCWQQWQEQA